MYAVGSDRNAAFLSGVRVARVRILAYSVGGLFAGTAGIVTTAFTGSGEPRASIGANATLNSVAAVVLGGRGAVGRRRRTGRAGVGRDVPHADPGDHAGARLDPSYAETARGVLIILVVMVGGLLQAEEEEHVTAAVATASARRDWRHIVAERPVIVLSGVLVVLYIVTGLQDDSLFTVRGLRSILLLACPLAIFAASQTLCMLTGGIDLSIAMTANFAAYVAANQSGQGTVVALTLSLLVGVGVGLVNGIGIGVFKVNPLIMTLGMASVLLGVVTVGLKTFLSGSTRILPLVDDIGSGTLIGPLPMNFIVWAVVATLIVLGLSSSGLGRMIYAVGDNPIACRLAGVRVWQVLLAVYVLSAVLAAVAGLLFSGTTGSVGPRPDQRLPAPLGRRGGDRRHVDPRRLGRLQRDHRRRAHPDRAEPAAAQPRTPARPSGRCSTA